MTSSSHKRLEQGARLCVLALMLLWTVSAPASERVHVVTRNDTLSGIARQHGVTVGDIVRRNQLRNSDYVQIGQRLVIPSKAPDYVEYTVKRGDSLAGIAQQFGVTVAALAGANVIRDPNVIVVGSVLRVPRSGAASPAPLSPPRPALDAGTRRSIDRVGVTPGRWKRIVLHHSGSALDTPRSMDDYHRLPPPRGRGMENGLAYHFVIGNGTRTGDGEIHIGRRWNEQLDGGHLASSALNAESIGICLVGDFNKTVPTPKQMESLHALVAHLMGRARLDATKVQTHRQANPRPTECPGEKFPTEQFLRDLKR